MKRIERTYRTDKKAWLIASIILFLPGWFVPIMMDEIPPWVLAPMLFTVPDNFSETAFFLGAFILTFGVPSIAFGWVLQCAYVLLKQNWKKVPPEIRQYSV